MITIVRAIQTCAMCPSQWDLWDANGQYYYARYRSGRASLCPHKDENWYSDYSDGTHMSDSHYLANVRYGDELDGYIELSDFAKLVGIELAL